ncbi:MAG TPA: cupredoxin domain-containing protein [Burkholderiales bacterium]|nr:cupredoxin domain-containing protein [Burkholderiales bacterium]
MHRYRLVVLAAALAAVPVSASAEDHVVVQKDKAFAVKTLKAKTGDKIVFRNEDPFAHNIFSLSPIQSFDLGTFGKGETKELVLSKPGKLEIECAIHPEMKMEIDVEK